MEEGAWAVQTLASWCRAARLGHEEAVNEENEPAARPSARSRIEEVEAPGSPPERQVRSRTLREPSGWSRNAEIQRIGGRARRELADAKRKKPSAPARSNSKKLGAGRSGSLPRQAGTSRALRLASESEKLVAERGGNFPEPKGSSRWRREVPNSKRWNPTAPGTSQFKGMDSFGVGKFPERSLA